MKKMPDGTYPECDFLTCFYGMGLAGRGICNAGGDWSDPKCPLYENEDTVLERWRLEDEEANSKNPC